ncbi:MAG: hypothetical protein C7B45_02490 [Sulfobacillus acidophilus]|uniref:PEP-utilising enzyme mobile domain-containing protein n=1 Tax=Sulfobacillus acidophilus TaxID=53633 RepID=A0A2T2WN43_9FIRM|nr:MAG: hypothetical protein C7B45_02490 [Sulfobacillus acidophilus]
MSQLKERITLSADDIKERLWTQDGLHFGHPLTPLFASYMVPAMTDGTRRAFESLKSPMRQFISKIHDGYYYQSVVPAEGDPRAIEREHRAVVAPLMGHLRENLARYVEDVLWPMHEEIDTLARTTQTNADAIATLSRLEEIYSTFWEAHFRIVMPRMAAGLGFEAVFKEAFPDLNSAEAYNLFVGVMNKTLESDRALWQLAEQAKREPQVMKALYSEDIAQALQSSPACEEYWTSVQNYLSVYGWRTMYAHEFIHETWIESPNYCLSIVRRYVEQDFDFDQHWGGIIKNREKRFQELLQQIGDASLRTRFQEQYANALEAWPIDEDHHFYIDAMLPARSRQIIRRVGALLADQGLLRTSDDICFLYLDEVMDSLSGSVPPTLQDRIDERRRAYHQQRQTTPVPQLGTPPEHSADHDPVSSLVFGAGSPGLEGATHEVRGFAASPGRYVGPVRIVRSPEEFFKVQHGDVLVCRTTAPSWTGLFATVGAVITETGGILSHASTVAREYGIPCVVGTREATRVFHDGDRVLVDGNRGIAVIEH